MDIPSPTGKEIWSKEIISKILSNEEYAGDDILGKTQVKNGVQVKAIDLSTRTIFNKSSSGNRFEEIV